jgi:hypothetical protein
MIFIPKKTLITAGSSDLSGTNGLGGGGGGGYNGYTGGSGIVIVRYTR